MGTRKGIIMAQTSKVERHADICKEINALYARKNHDYGDSFRQTFAEEGLTMARIRLGDKLARFNTLTKEGGQQVSDESIRDTLIDLANYAIMTVMELDDQKGGEVQKSDNTKRPVDLRTSLYKKAVWKFGMKSQILMAIEEMSELTKALLKFIRNVDYNHGDGRAIVENIDEERADVTIMLGQLDVIFSNNSKMMEKKLAHLKKIVEESK